MSRLYYDYRKAKVNLYYALKAKGWRMFNFKEDESDSMTDYYSPASWSPAIAEKNGVIFVCDVAEYEVKRYSGYEVYEYTQNTTTYKDNSKITKLQAIANDQAATEGEKQAAQEAINRITEHAEQSQENREKTKVLKYVYPSFMANPGKSKWHLEKDGKILDKGTGLSKFADLPSDWQFDYEKMEWKESYAYHSEWQNGEYVRVKKEVTEETRKLVEQFNALITRIDNIGNGCIVMSDGTEETEAEGLEAEAKQGYEKVIVNEKKKVWKMIPVERSYFQAGDYITLPNHNHYWKIEYDYMQKGTWQGVTEQRKAFVYERVGAASRGYQKLRNTERYYQYEFRMLKYLEEGKAKIFELKEVEEIIPTEKWVKIDKTKRTAPKTNNTTKQAEQQEQTQEQPGNNSILGYQYTITADTDTRDNSALWVVKIKDKLTKEEYVKVSEQFKKLKGYYSKFKHGFIFRYDPTEVLKGNNSIEQEEPKTTKAKINVKEISECIIDYSTDLILDLGLNTREYETNENYKQSIAEYIRKNQITITDSILDYINKDFPKLAEILKDIENSNIKIAV